MMRRSRPLRPFAALDIATDAVRAAVATVARRGTLVMRVAEQPLRADAPRDDVLEAAAALLAQLGAPLDRFGMHPDDGHTTMLLAEFPPLSAKDLPDAIRSHLTLLLNERMERTAYGFTEITRDEHAVRSLIATTPTSHAEELTHLADALGGHLQLAQPRAISIANAYTHFATRTDELRLLIHVGAERASLALLLNGGLRLARVAPAGRRALAEQPELLQQEALATLEAFRTPTDLPVPTHVTGLEPFSDAIRALADSGAMDPHPLRLDAIEIDHGGPLDAFLPALGLAVTGARAA